MMMEADLDAISVPIRTGHRHLGRIYAYHDVNGSLEREQLNLPLDGTESPSV